MKNSPLVIIMLAVIHLSSCQNQIPLRDINHAPIFDESDEKYSDVFKPLDGTWKGRFFIYEDKAPTKLGETDLKDISTQSLDRNNLQLIDSINVQQEYSSKSPYFQRVTIIDHYPNTGEKVISHGVNKIQDGKMWCVVKKPNELVMHEGKNDGQKTIIWFSESPEKSEYFKETVESNTYEIVGWGYYEGDDRKLTPRLWFYGKYERQ